MFSIGFTDEPLVDPEPGEEGLVGLLVLGEHKERFVSHLWTWSKEQYVDHWKRALNRVLGGSPAALITDMRTPVQSSHLIWWPMWRINAEIVLHNQLLFFAQHDVAGADLNLDTLYRLIGRRSSHNSEGAPISEWSIAVSEVEIFLCTLGCYN